MVAKVQIKRTSTNDLPPSGLLPGELSVEMGVPTRLWVGVPTNLDASGKKLLAAPVTGNFVLKSGDTMTGSLTIAPPAGNSPQLTLNKAPVSGYECNVMGQRNGLNRWLVCLGNGTAESTGNAGSDFAINAYNDSGVFAYTAMWIRRSNGAFNVGPLVTAPGGAGNNGVIYFGADLQHYMSFNGVNYTIQGSTAENFIINTSVTVNGSLTSLGNFQCASSIQSNTGYRTKAGVSGPITSNYFNFDWSGVGVIAWMDNVNVGQIAIVSDYRIKQNVNPMPSTWEKVKALNPVTYNYKQNDQFMVKGDTMEHWGFIAHELQNTLTVDASTGIKDAPNVLQSPNALVLIAALTRALQEAMARIEALEAK